MLREERNGGARGYGRGGCVGNNQGEVTWAVGAAVVDHSAAIGFMTSCLDLEIHVMIGRWQYEW